MAKRTLHHYLVSHIALTMVIGLVVSLCIAFLAKWLFNITILGVFAIISGVLTLFLLGFCWWLCRQLIQLQLFLDNSATTLGDNHGINAFFQKSAKKIQDFHQEKQQLNERHQQLDVMRKDFVANVSHELRTPLTVLMGYIETISDQDDLPVRWQRAFLQMSQQSQRMNSIINDLLLLSRLENDEKPANTSKIDMSKLLIQLFDDAQVYNKNFEHLIHLQLNSQKNIMGYEDYLNSAFSNLITNAIKYTANRGEITIAWETVETGAVFSVSDNGIGIEPQHIERLTERFYRVDTGRSRETGGTGLGLAIVKHVLHQHQAKLSITSTLGKGSTFSIFFPNSVLTD